ncbi:MAG: hypothetical protein A3J65_02080 [Candidatus Buchananbacteria bacterium RIFCSPHIGHO2_02_FULL_45_11b]|uniref:Uncharacterized protein n=4 Tax=Candidatus Buchananiibacteriota TaxID=1817903 RepID=A0A1G1Y2C5_9BACT|nr:MAG: hypothetical protein A2663_02780 [Candidatus Buchananbacteria bacterium RIFCSPHIGHO2_01_FULL_46_12]OGY52745.1 MAG: hypothetical protein A3J65_02080 [Candidatus Buchananbacteria bacterium RIFCSPHIGHO2_02_FULL_45_11b]OGY52797.1 MAG: hypothetical protein A3B15_01470 [Candidatus Buchananbacteria bacterium RIFCSPLOWO2_01_FULL_45_31]OGY57817.1 MAG: hypothetical protein A3H67_03325 [Candidatus Buchananbacteria bacterium RIFCSPLOWO2_02_FULL_46_11b]
MSFIDVGIKKPAKPDFLIFVLPRRTPNEMRGKASFDCLLKEQYMLMPMVLNGQILGHYIRANNLSN